MAAISFCFFPISSSPQFHFYLAHNPPHFVLNLREQETNPVVILFDKRLFLWYNENKEIFQMIYTYFLEFFQIKFFYFFQEIFQKNQEKSSRKIWN